MRRVFSLILFGAFFLVVGLGIGVAFGSQMKSAMVAKFPWARSLGEKDKNSPIESYDYPTIKFRPKPLNEAQGAIVQLWTRFEKGDPGSQTGKMNYKLTVFKAPNKNQCEVQLLDDMGFKLFQFDASDFHQMAGAADIMEARDSCSCSEEIYRKIQDYSIK